MCLLDLAHRLWNTSLTQQLREAGQGKGHLHTLEGELELGRRLKDLKYSMGGWALPTEEGCSRETQRVLLEMEKGCGKGWCPGRKTSKETLTAVSGSSLWCGLEQQWRRTPNRMTWGIFRSLIFKNTTFLLIL